VNFGGNRRSVRLGRSKSAFFCVGLERGPISFIFASDRNAGQATKLVYSARKMRAALRPILLGGEGEIRTHDGIATMPVFKSRPTQSRSLETPRNTMFTGTCRRARTQRLRRFSVPVPVKCQWERAPVWFTGVLSRSNAPLAHAAKLPNHEATTVRDVSARASMPVRVVVLLSVRRVRPRSECRTLATRIAHAVEISLPASVRAARPDLMRVATTHPYNEPVATHPCNGVEVARRDFDQSAPTPRSRP
jgi:hypothetical protein